jgi:hypothetical protein
MGLAGVIGGLGNRHAKGTGGDCDFGHRVTVVRTRHQVLPLVLWMIEQRWIDSSYT